MSWATSAVVSVVALVMRVHEFGGQRFCRSTEGRGVFVGLLSSNINNQSPESLTPPLRIMQVGKGKILTRVAGKDYTCLCQ